MNGVLDYFMESTVLRRSCWCIRKWVNERVSFLILKQRVRRYRTKHFPCCNLFILYLLRFSPSTRFPSFLTAEQCQVMYLFRCLSAKNLVQIFFVQNMFTLWSVNASASFDLFCLPYFFLKSFSLSFQTFPCLVKHFIVDNACSIFAGFF